MTNGKTDMERLGIFKELGYISIGDKYTPAGRVIFNENAGKGKQFRGAGTKKISALQDGYFSSSFPRIFDKEAYSDPVRIKRQDRLKETQKNISKPFLPSSGEKQPSGLGSNFGTIDGRTPAFNPEQKPKSAAKLLGKNFYTNPGKTGTGYGYGNVTLSPYHKHLTDEYERYKQIRINDNTLHKKSIKGPAFKLNMHGKDFFDVNPFIGDKPRGPDRAQTFVKSDFKPFKPTSPPKNPGGMKAGTFDSYPSHSEEPYVVKVGKPVQVNKEGKLFLPTTIPKSAPTVSIVNRNITHRMNQNNYRSMASVIVF